MVNAWSGGGLGVAGIALAFAFVVIAMVYAIGQVSGAHINPAVTLAFVVRRSFPIGRAIGYWIVQFAGAVLAALVLRAFFNAAVANGVTGPGQGVTQFEAACWEAMLSLLLVSIILGTSEEEAVVGKNAALAVGLTVALCGLFSSPVSGASMNPARSFGPARVSGHMSDAWIYFAGPLFGALVARALDGWWRDAGSPDPFLVIEAGAGRGRLAVDVLAAAPDPVGGLDIATASTSATADGPATVTGTTASTVAESARVLAVPPPPASGGGDGVLVVLAVPPSTARALAAAQAYERLSVAVRVATTAPA